MSEIEERLQKLCNAVRSKSVGRRIPESYYVHPEDFPKWCKLFGTTAEVTGEDGSVWLVDEHGWRCQKSAEKK